MEIEAKIIVNKSSIGDINLIKNVSKEYGVEIVGKIPYEEGILKNYSKGIPVFHALSYTFLVSCSNDCNNVLCIDIQKPLGHACTYNAYCRFVDFELIHETDERQSC